MGKAANKEGEIAPIEKSHKPSKLPTWDELAARFSQLEPALQFSRIDGQTGAAGEHWRIAGAPARDAEERFKATVNIASARLEQDFPDEIAKHKDIIDEQDPLIRWYKALRHIGNRYESDHYGAQINDDGSSGGFIFLGTISQPAAGSQTLYLTLASRVLTGGNAKIR